MPKGRRFACRHLWDEYWGADSGRAGARRGLARTGPGTSHEERDETKVCKGVSWVRVGERDPDKGPGEQPEVTGTLAVSHRGCLLSLGVGHGPARLVTGSLQPRSRGRTEEGPGPTWVTGVEAAASARVGGHRGDGVREGGVRPLCV